ncbi:MAG: hypothetical protein GY800_08130 [Planctomycetes bacterium]|nr:hypothetical protein [Planctomycetota bacterium]
MSCYFRHMPDILKEAGVEVTFSNKKEVDRLVHSIVGVDYKDCSGAWKAVKGQRTEEGLRAELVEKLRKGFSG